MFVFFNKKTQTTINILAFFQESEMETEEEVDILMSSDIYSATLSTKSITFTRAQTGWLFREDKTVRLFNNYFKTSIHPVLVCPREDVCKAGETWDKNTGCQF